MGEERVEETGEERLPPGPGRRRRPIDDDEDSHPFSEQAMNPRLHQTDCPGWRVTLQKEEKILAFVKNDSDKGWVKFKLTEDHRVRAEALPKKINEGDKPSLKELANRMVQAYFRASLPADRQEDSWADIEEDLKSGALSVPKPEVVKGSSNTCQRLARLIEAQINAYCPRRHEDENEDEDENTEIITMKPKPP